MSLYRVFAVVDVALWSAFFGNVKHSKERQKNVTMVLRIVGVTTGSRILLVLVPNNAPHRIKTSVEPPSTLSVVPC